MKRVCIIQRVMCDYRKKFYLLLHGKLLSENISLVVCAGLPWPGEGFVDVLGELGFGARSENIKIAGKAYWQKGALGPAKNTDLIIFEQANSALINYYLLLKRKLGGKAKVAYWGHGWHFSKNSGVRNSWKRFFANKTDWWFAYTELSAKNVEKTGFPRDKITVLNNAVDTTSMRNERKKVTATQLAALREELFGQDKLPNSEYVFGVFSGRLVEDKMIPFLLESVELIHEKIPNFRMIIIGDGPEKNRVARFCEKNRWCAWLGRLPTMSERGIIICSLGDIWIHPGAVGLAILDAFSFGIPLVTTDIGVHGPEIAYLEQDVNGMITDHTPLGYATAVVDILNNKDRLENMRRAATRSSELYTVEAMAENYAEGIIKCLSA
ncbi:hypothetical protein MNBD_NITROSPINAE02-1488 [hydrothermal vent metagenome]|uniref:Uncharacterized protein n=1 Tax=hydrothermal vent metagenome TaxID=652676 RepID=A0A3B1D080_9ZZZZ